jgi:hypothetical protein
VKKGDKKKQQKALARRTEAKRDKAAKARGRGGSLTMIRNAHAYPPLGCWVKPGWREDGLAVVVVARRQPDRRVVWGTYLVDYYCLGIKNCTCNANAPYDMFIDAMLPQFMQGERAEPISPDLAYELIYGGIEYAARWGFKPHPDFDLAQCVLDPPELHPRRGQITFGKDGKPFYIDGPDDDPQAIIAQLNRTAGPGNYDYMVHIGPSTKVSLPERVERDDEEEKEGDRGISLPTLYLPGR